MGKIYWWPVNLNNLSRQETRNGLKNDYHKNWKEWQKEFNRKSNDDFEPVSEYVVMANAANAANAAKVSEEFSKKSKRKSNRDGFRSSLEN